MRQALLWPDDPAPEPRREPPVTRALLLLAARIERGAGRVKGDARTAREEAAAELRLLAGSIEWADKRPRIEARARAKRERERVERAEFEAADRARSKKGGKA